jgi:hypothetical protein
LHARPTHVQRSIGGTCICGIKFRLLSRFYSSLVINIPPFPPPKNAKIRCTSGRLARVEDTLFAPKPLTQQAKAHPHLTLSASEKGVSRPRKDLSPLLSQPDSNSHALNSSRVWTCNPHRTFLSLINFLSRIRKAKISDAGNTRSHTRSQTHTHTHTHQSSHWDLVI